MKQASLGPKQRNAFRNKYLAAIITVAALLFSSVVSAQSGPTRSQLQDNNALGYEYLNGAYRKLFYIPLDTFATADSGAIAYKNGKFWLKKPQWTELSSASTPINLANASLVANGDYTQNWNQKILKFNTTRYTEFNSYRPDPLLVAGNTFLSKFYLDSTVNGRPFSLSWALRNGANDGDSIRGVLETNESTTTILNAGDNNNQFGNWQFIGNSSNPRLTGTLVGGLKSSSYSFGHVATINPNDSVRIKLESAAATAKIIGIRSESSGLWTPVAIDIPTGSGSTTLSNIGSGHRLVKTADGQMKTIFVGYGLDADSATNTNGITFKADTSELVTPSDLADAIAGVSGSPAGSNTQIQYNNSGAFGAEAAFTYDASTNKLTVDNANLNGLTANRPLKLNGSKDIISTQIDLASTNDVTGELPESNMQAFKSYPAEHAIGTIFERSKWDGATMAAEFTNVGGTSIALNGNFPRSTSATVAWTTYHRFLPLRPTLLHKWSFTVEFQIVSALASNIGFGPALRTNNTAGANFGYGTYLACFSSTGTPHLAKEDGTADQTNGSFTVSQGDVIRMTLAFNDSVMTLVSQNITTSSSIVTVTKTFVAGTAPYVPNTGTLGFQNFSGTYEIRYVKFSSNATASPNIGIAFDSKGQIISTSFLGRFPSQLNSNFPTVLNYSGGGDQLKDFIDKKEEVLRINAEQWWIGLGSNDLRYGNSLATTMERVRIIKSWFTGTSTRLYWSVVPEDSTGSGLGLSNFHAALSAEAGANYIDLWNPMSTSNVLDATYNSGDDVHPNQAGQNIMASTGIASGLLTTISTQRRAPYNRFGGGIKAVGDSLTMDYQLERAINNVPRFNDSADMVPSMIYHNATKVIISPNLLHAPAVTGSTLLQVDGLISTSGNGGVITYDRTTPTNYHFFYSDANFGRFNYTGTDHSSIDALGRWKIGTDGGTVTNSALHIRKSYSITPVATTGVGFALDSATITVNTASHPLVTYATIAAPTYAAAATTSIVNAPTLYIDREPQAGTNVTLLNPWALYIKSGKTRLGTVDSTSSPVNMLYEDVNGEIKKAAVPSGGSGITSINSETGASQTIAPGSGISVNSSSNTHTITAYSYPLDKQYTDANNTGTSATDLYTYTIPANTLASNGNTITFETSGVFNDATATVNLQALFAGNGIAGAGLLTISGTGNWNVKGYAMRTGTTTARTYAVISIDNSTNKIYSTTGVLTGLDFTTTNIIKITGTAGGAGGGSNDITGQTWMVDFKQ